MKEKTKKLILLIMICVVTLLILFVALKLHENRKSNILSNSSIKNYLSEIKYEEIANHVVENPSAIIYVSNSREKASADFEKKFKEVIKKYNLNNDIIYININETTIVDHFYQYAPELVFYKDGEVNDVLDCTTLKNEKEIIKVLKERGVIGD